MLNALPCSDHLLAGGGLHVESRQVVGSLSSMLAGGSSTVTYLQPPQQQQHQRQGVMGGVQHGGQGGMQQQLQHSHQLQHHQQQQHGQMQHAHQQQALVEQQQPQQPQYSQHQQVTEHKDYFLPPVIGGGCELASTCNWLQQLTCMALCTIEPLLKVVKAAACDVHLSVESLL